MANYVAIRIQKNLLIHILAILMPFFFIFTSFNSSLNALFYRESHASWYLDIIIIWHWCGSMFVFFSFQPLKLLFLIFIHTCHHILECYWIKFPFFISPNFGFPPLLGIFGMFTANLPDLNTRKELKSKN